MHATKNIKTKTEQQWKTIVKTVVNKKNKVKLIKGSEKLTGDEIHKNTKTKSIYEKLTSDEPYICSAQNEVIHGTTQRTKTMMLACYGMWERVSNFKGTILEIYQTCNTLGNEQRRLKDYSVLENMNCANNPLQINFDDIYSSNLTALDHILGELKKVWEFRYANGHVKRNLCS